MATKFPAREDFCVELFNNHLVIIGGQGNSNKKLGDL